MSHMCKRIFTFELQLRSYWQNIKFSRYCPKFNILTNIVIFQVYLQLFRSTASSPYKFYGRDMSGILFFIFGSCEPLNNLIHHFFVFVFCFFVFGFKKQSTLKNPSHLKVMKFPQNMLILSIWKTIVNSNMLRLL